MKKREYIQANRDWLVEKAKEEGVVALSGGVLYKVLETGRKDGKHPTVRSIVSVNYVGRTIDGNEFDSNRGRVPLAMRLCDLIDGWIVALGRMCIGDKWEVYMTVHYHNEGSRCTGHL